MNQHLAKGIILSRTDYGEADRIISVLTPEHGKLSLMARGVRRPKSKLAGGIELFSTADITYLKGRGQIGALISARLIKYYANIVKDLDRVRLGYDLIKMLNRATEDQPETEYFTLLEQTFNSLDDANVGLDLIRLWFQAQLLKHAGHQPNLLTDTSGQNLTAGQTYNFDFEAMNFSPHQAGSFSADHIKTLRLLFSHNPPTSLQKVRGIDQNLPPLSPLIQTVLTSYIRI